MLSRSHSSFACSADHRVGCQRTHGRGDGFGIRQRRTTHLDVGARVDRRPCAHPDAARSARGPRRAARSVSRRASRRSRGATRSPSRAWRARWSSASSPSLPGAARDAVASARSASARSRGTWSSHARYSGDVAAQCSIASRDVVRLGRAATDDRDDDARSGRSGQTRRRMTGVERRLASCARRACMRTNPPKIERAARPERRGGRDRAGSRGDSVSPGPRASRRPRAPRTRTPSWPAPMRSGNRLWLVTRAPRGDASAGADGVEHGCDLARWPVRAGTVEDELVAAGERRVEPDAGLGDQSGEGQRQATPAAGRLRAQSRLPQYF